METQTATAAGAATKPASFIPEAPGAAGQPHLCPPPGEGGVRKGREGHREKEALLDLREEEEEERERQTQFCSARLCDLELATYLSGPSPIN